MWPVISKIINLNPLISFDYVMSRESIRVVWRSHELNVGFFFIKLVCITRPFV
ncbi:hypothetical protein HanRHA438_Chr10g0452821 [Helianthus annuus]|nr:hypothetical protein HanRHA438_Chr10g0452821 [Helianthus annuus]